MNKIDVYNKVMLKSEDSKGSYGPGVDKLIRKVIETGSLNKATKEMNMSYSKAWKLLNRTEEMLGFELIERHAGAKGSNITEEGRKLIEYYDLLNEACEQAIEKVKSSYEW